MGLLHHHGHGHHDHHDHGHDHHHGRGGHEHAHGEETDHEVNAGRALGWALWLNFGFLIIEAAVGFYFGSIAVLSDAGHMVADVAALAIAFLAQRLSRVRGGAGYTFGWRRLPIIGGLANALTLNAIVVLIIAAAIARFRSPVPVQGEPVLVIGVLGLLVNLGGAWILHRRGGRGVNVRAALMHLMADALGSVGVIISGVVLATTGWSTIDPLMSLLIASMIAFGTWPLLRDLARTLLLGSPAEIDVDRVRSVFTEDANVLCLEDFHLWELDTDYVVLSARVHAKVDTLEDAEGLRTRISGRLKSEFKIDHVTIEVGPHRDGDQHGENDCLRQVS